MKCYGIPSWQKQEEWDLECWKLKSMKQSLPGIFFPCAFMRTVSKCLFSVNSIRTKGINHSNFFPRWSEEIFIKISLKHKSQKSQISNTKFCNLGTRETTASCIKFAIQLIKGNAAIWALKIINWIILWLCVGWRSKQRD